MSLIPYTFFFNTALFATFLTKTLLVPIISALGRIRTVHPIRRGTLFHPSWTPWTRMITKSLVIEIFIIIRLVL